MSNDYTSQVAQGTCRETWLHGSEDPRRPVQQETKGMKKGRLSPPFSEMLTNSYGDRQRRNAPSRRA